MLGVLKISTCLIIFVVFKFCSGAYENNPFLNPPTTQAIPPSVSSTTDNNGPTVSTNPVPASTSTTYTTAPSTSSTGVANGDLDSKCLKPRGQFPSFVCNKYVNCWDGRAIEQTCPQGLVFNADKGYCDYLPNTDCGKRSLEGAEISNVPVSVPGHQTLSSSTNTGVFPNLADIAPSMIQSPSLVTPADATQLGSLCKSTRGLFLGSSCNKFVNCWDENVVEIECPAGTLFSSKGYCDFAANVDCEHYRDTTDYEGVHNAENQNIALGTHHNEASVVKPTTECPLEFGTFRDKHNCSQYYICAYFKIAVTHACPEGLSFSDILGLCDYSYRVDCSKEPQIYTKDSPVPRTQNQLYTIGDCSVDYGTVRDSQNCSTYHVCANRRVVASYDCPGGFSYNDDLGICDYSERVDCSKPPRIFTVDLSNPTILPNIPQEIMEKVKSCSPGSIFPLNAECSSACICRAGMVEIVECGIGLAYNPSINKCVSASLVQC